ncbi:uncharacterized protein LOC141904353 [Tubulanus polymorphus]|uniref:uncharacterized protein LOC141904353 n=1 Tax=Tubulanus polymorphus TaxID=672921 RepID=UPI003DA4D781
MATEEKEMRRIQRGQFTKLRIQCENHIKDNQAVQGTCVLATLKKKLSQLEQLDLEIYAKCGLAGSAYENLIVQSDDIINSHHMKLTEMELALNELSIQSRFVPSETASASFTSTSSLSLPKLQIPKFDGDILHWQSFWDLFISAVDKQTKLSEIEKFNHLKCLLIKDASTVIEGLSLTSENYNSAKSMLVARFGRPHRISEAYLDALINLEAPYYDLRSVRTFYETIEQKIRSLEALGIETNSYGTLLVQIIRNKLPKEIIYNISRDHGNGKWNLFELRAALLREVEILETCQDSSDLNSNFTTTLQVQARKLECLFCKGEHRNNDCTVVKQPDARLGVVFKSRLCFNCLGKHRSNCCRSSFRCRICQCRHHTSLCGASMFQYRQSQNQNNTDRSKTTVSNDASSKSDNVNDNPSAMPVNDFPALNSKANKPKFKQRSLMTNSGGGAKVLLKTAVARVCSSYNGSIRSNLLFDDGSQRSFITKELVEKLCLKPHKQEYLDLSGFGAATGFNKTVDIVRVDVICNDNTQVQIEAVVVAFITRPMSVHGIDQIDEFKSLELAHSREFYSNAFSISILIGVDFYYQFVLGNDFVVSSIGPIAVPTKLGYLVSGPQAAYCLQVNADSVDEIGQNSIKKFWDLDLIGIRPPETDPYLDWYCDNCISFDNGIYNARLPWKSEHGPLPTNYNVAKARTRSTARKLSKTPGLLKQYNDIITEQLSRDFIELVDDPGVLVSSGCVSREHYIPHHGIFKQSATTPLRIVFDCSCRASRNSNSLNDCLEAGTPLLNDITSILLRFRLFKYGIITDIEKAFLHVGLHVDDRDVTRFFWLRDPLDPEGEFNIYRFKGGNFNLRCWSSTCSDLREAAGREAVLERSNSVKVLGIKWDVNHDSLTLLYDNLSSVVPITKRLILSNISSVYDPFGFLTPITVQSKILMQDIWKLSVDWDDSLSSELCSRWSSVVKDMREASTFEFPRQVIDSAMFVSGQPELHVFCDSSSRAFGAVTYIRCVDQSAFLMSKSRVAPIKKLSIPQLELCAAVIGARLVSHVAKSLEPALCRPLNIFAWSDSQIVLGWLVGRSGKKVSQFVENRRSEINRLIDIGCWGFCPSEENPADLITRGVTCETLNQCSTFWFKGPSWLVDENNRPVKLFLTMMLGR